MLERSKSKLSPSILQDRIIAYFLHRDPSSLDDPHPSVSTSERQSFLVQLASGAITDRDEEAFLLHITPPWSPSDPKDPYSKDPEDPRSKTPLQAKNAPEPTDFHTLYERISAHPLERQMLAIATGYNAKTWDKFNQSDLENLLSAPKRNDPDFRTPVALRRFTTSFLENIKDRATPNQYADYLAAETSLRRTLYGERSDYDEQFRSLKHLATTSVPAHSSVPSTPTPLPTPLTPTTPAPLDVPLNTIPRERSLELLSHAVINGDPWRQDGQEYRLTTNHILSANLLPLRELTVGTQPIALSDVFNISNDRIACLGFASTPSGVEIHSYYRDLKSGLWHYLPDYINGAQGDNLHHLGHGYSEASTALPAPLQKALASISHPDRVLEIEAINSDFIFAGTAYAYSSLQVYRDALQTGQARGSFYQSVSRTPLTFEAEHNPHRKSAPQLLSINIDLAPNFDRPVAVFSSYSILAGDLTLKSFLSNDEQYIWTFASDERGRTWIDNIETTSRITSTGCRQDWIISEDFETPLYEHPRLADNYGDPSDTRLNGSLVCMWNNYLSKIPLIQQYLS